MLLRFVIPLAFAILAGACSRGEEVKCAGGSAYLAAGSAGQLRVPDDLSVPDETEALRVPEAVPAPEDPGVECLEHSPAFLSEE